MVWLQCEGVGKDSIPGAIDFDVVDDMMQVTDKQSFTVGSSSIVLTETDIVAVTTASQQARRGMVNSLQCLLAFKCCYSAS